MAQKTHQPCPHEGCGSSDAFSWNTEGYGKCHSCDQAYPSKGMRVEDWAAEYYPLSKGEDQVKDEFQVVDDPFADNTPKPKEKNNKGGEPSYRAMRGITVATMQKFEVKTNDMYQGYVYPTGKKKFRNIVEKDFFAESGFKTDMLWAMNIFPAGCSKKITITEGEIDAMSAYQMLNTNKNFVNPVVSLPSATPSGKLWEKVHKYLDSFEEIVLSVDNDDNGRAVAETMFDLFPEKVYVVSHGDLKDANDFLVSGKAQSFVNNWWKRKKYSPAGFTSGDDWVDAVMNEEPYTYVETPIDDFNKAARGLVKGGITVVKAPPGTGKTSLFRRLEHDLVMNKDQRVAVLHMEEMKSTTARGMATYELEKNVNTKEDAADNLVQESEVVEAVRRVVDGDKFVAFDINPQDAIEDCLRMVKYAVAVYKVDYVFIDHLQRLAYLTGVEGATAGLTELGVRLVEFAKRKNIGIICISHVNEQGKTKYATSIEEEAIVIIELSRDKNATDFEERNTTNLSVTKNRPFANTGAAGALRYDPESTLVYPKNETEGEGNEENKGDGLKGF